MTGASRLATFGGYRLYAEPDRLRIEAGVLTEARIAARRERIQLLEVQRDLPHQWLGIERIRYETADVETQGTIATTYLSPAGRAGDWPRLADLAIGGTLLSEDALQPVSRLTMRRTVIRGLWGVAAGAAAGWFIGPWLAVLAVVTGTFVLVVYARRRYRVLGWALDHQHLLIRTGVAAERLRLVRLDKVQIVRTNAGLFQRRLGLASVALSTAGTGTIGVIAIPDLELATADDLAATLARRAGRTPLAETL